MSLGHIQMHFLEWKYANFDKDFIIDFIEFVPNGPINKIPVCVWRMVYSGYLAHV